MGRTTLPGWDLHPSVDLPVCILSACSLWNSWEADPLDLQARFLTFVSTSFCHKCSVSPLWCSSLVDVAALPLVTQVESRDLRTLKSSVIQCPVSSACSLLKQENLWLLTCDHKGRCVVLVNDKWSVWLEWNALKCLFLRAVQCWGCGGGVSLGGRVAEEMSVQQT